MLKLFYLWTVLSKVIRGRPMETTWLLWLLIPHKGLKHHCPMSPEYMRKILNSAGDTLLISLKGTLPLFAKYPLRVLFIKWRSEERRVGNDCRSVSCVGDENTLCAH